MIGIHTPEFDYEKKRSQVEGAVKKYNLDHPIMMDNDYAFWNALGNHYWPAFYLVDKKGNIVKKLTGEMHSNTGRADEAEELIEKLLAES